MELDNGVDCTTLNVLKNTEFCIGEGWIICELYINKAIINPINFKNKISYIIYMWFFFWSIE